MWKVCKDFFHASDDSVIKHHLDAMRMMRGLREDSLYDSFCQFSCALILLLDNTHFHSRLNLRTTLTIHHSIMRKRRPI